NREVPRGHLVVTGGRQLQTVLISALERSPVILVAMSEVTRILRSLEQGDERAAADLLPLVYKELRRLARQQMGRERVDHTLEPTALVHEAYLRLVGTGPVRWDGNGHFFAAAAEAMRRILVEH